MANKLAKLADLKTAIGATTTGNDDFFTALLEDASAIAERVAGVAAGGLRRQTGIVEYPTAAWDDAASIHLAVRPIESITQIVQLYTTGADADFTAAVTAGDTLTENEDYVITSATMGAVVRIHGRWYLRPRCLRVTYVAGYADPDDDVGGDSIEPPDDLQRAVIAQATQLYNLRKSPGLKSVNAGKGGSNDLTENDVHPLLASAAGRLRRIL